MRVGSFLPSQATYYINGHSFLETELNRDDIPFRKRDNAFLSIDSPKALQQASDRFTPKLLQQRFDYWTFLLGPKFSKREQRTMDLRRFYAFCQVEYCLNVIFRRTFPLHQLFERSCELGLFELTAEKVSQRFGQRPSGPCRFPFVPTDRSPYRFRPYQNPRDQDPRYPLDPPHGGADAFRLKRLHLANS